MVDSSIAEGQATTAFVRPGAEPPPEPDELMTNSSAEDQITYTAYQQYNKVEVQPLPSLPSSAPPPANVANDADQLRDQSSAIHAIRATAEEREWSSPPVPVRHTVPVRTTDSNRPTPHPQQWKFAAVGV